MLFEFVSKIGDFLKPKLSRVRASIDKIFKKNYKSGQNTEKMVSEQNFSGASSSFHTPERLAPDSVEEFIEVIQHTPLSVLSKADRARIAAVMSFGERKVRDLMAPREKMVFVKEVDLLGPIMLDKLYKSGLTSFPVVDSYRRLKGVLHTEELNALETKKTDRASKYMDKAIYYLHDNDSLVRAIEEMKQTNNYYFFVVDKEEHLVGFITVEMILNYFLGE